MSMSKIERTEITPARLLSSSVAEDTHPAYDAGTTYAEDDRVHRPGTHRVYHSLVDSNTGNTPESSPAFWKDVGPTNRYAMFDAVVQTVTTSADDIVVTLRPGPVSGLLLAQLQDIRAVRVRQRKTVGGDLVYDKSKSLSIVPIVDWKSWTLAPFKYRREVAFVDLLPYLDSEVEITLHGIGTRARQCGMVCIGVAVDLGDPQRGIGRGGISYASIETDDFGTTTIQPGLSVREVDFELMAHMSQLEVVCDALDEAKQVPAGFVPSPLARYGALNVYGLVDTYKASLPEYDWIRVSGRIKGLT